MNERRIRELAEQAWAADCLENFPGWKWSDMSDLVIEDGAGFNKKFAELIVRECAEVADNADATREKWQGIGKFVRDHFGVE